MYKQIVSNAINAFNRVFSTKFSLENIVVCSLTSENEVEVFESFCKEYFPYRLNDNYKDLGYFDFCASAFVAKGEYKKDGILIRKDVDYYPGELYHIVLHELAHIFCVHNELNGELFYDSYCDGWANDTITDGIVNAGYAIWRETIAEIIARDLDGGYFLKPLDMAAPIIAHYIGSMTPENGKDAITTILVEIFTSTEAEGSYSWDQLEKKIRALNIFTHKDCYNLFSRVYHQLDKDFHEINVDFIMEIGNLYLTILAREIIGE